MIDKVGTLDDGGDGQVDEGDVINYALTVTNEGNVSRQTHGSKPDS